MRGAKKRRRPLYPSTTHIKQTIQDSRQNSKPITTATRMPVPSGRPFARLIKSPPCPSRCSTTFYSSPLYRPSLCRTPRRVSRYSYIPLGYRFVMVVALLFTELVQIATFVKPHTNNLISIVSFQGTLTHRIVSLNVVIVECTRFPTCVQER